MRVPTFTLKIGSPPIEISMDLGTLFASAKQLADILSELHLIRNTIMAALDDLQAAVAAESTIIDSAITLLNGLKTALDAAIASNNPAALTQLSADITAKTKALSDALVANTPAATP